MPRRLPRVGIGEEPYVPLEPGTPEWYSNRRDPFPGYGRSRTPSYGRPTQADLDESDQKIKTMAAWQARDLIRQRLAAVTAAKLYGTARRGPHLSQNPEARGTPTYWFDDQNRLVATRSGALRSYLPVSPGSTQMTANPVYGQAPIPEGSFRMFANPRRLAVNPMVR